MKNTRSNEVKARPSENSRLQRRQAGKAARRATALLIVIGIVSVLSVLVIHFHDISAQRLRLGAGVAGRAGALSLARCGVLLAWEALRTDTRSYFFLPASNPAHPFNDPGNPTDLEKAYFWLATSVTSPKKLEGGTVSIKLTDDMGRMSLNRSRTQQLASLIQVIGITKLEKGDIFKEGIRKDRSREMACSIVDWRDFNTIVELGMGAEDEYYRKLTPGYPCSNSPLLATGELLFVKNFDSSDLYGRKAGKDTTATYPDGWIHHGLSPYVTPFGSGNQVNVNNAAPEVMAALPGIYESPARKTILKEIVANRPYRSLAEFRSIINTHAPRAWGILFPYITLASNRYRIFSTGEVNGRKATVEAVLQRSGRGYIVLMWKER